MKEHLTIISDDLNHNRITEEEARAKLLILFGINGNFSDWYTNGFKDGLAHRTLKCKCGEN